MATPAEVIEQSMSSGFDEGLQRRHQNQDFHKQTEWQDKHSDLREAIKNTQQKLWNLDKNSPDYAAQHAQGLKDLTTSIQAYQDFLHPEKNPGMWEKVRAHIGMEGKPHPLAAPQRISSETTPGVEASTVDLGSGPVAMPATPAFKTSTAGPTPTPDESSSKPLYPSQIKEKAKRLQESQQQAVRLEAGAPETDDAKANRELQAKYRQIDASPLSPEDKAEAKRKLWGIYAKPNQKLFKLADGTKQYFDADRPDLLPPGATAYVKEDAGSTQLGEFNDAVAQGYSGTYPQWLGEQKAKGAKPKYAWAKDEKGHIYATLLDPVTNQEVPNSRNYGAVPPTSLVGRITTGHYHYTDPLTGEVHDIVQTNSSTPNSGGGFPSAAPNASTSAPSGGGSGTPSGVHHSTSGSAPSSPHQAGAASGRDTVIGHKGTKDEVDTKAALEGAKDRVETMDQNLADAMKDKDNQQAMLSLIANHIGMTLGAQKGARINQAVWNEAVASAPWIEASLAKMFHFDADKGEYVLDGWKTGVTLTPDQMKQMVELAHQKEQTLEHHMERLKQEREHGGESGGTKPKVSLKKAMGLDFNKGKSEADVRKDIEAHGNEVIP